MIRTFAVNLAFYWLAILFLAPACKEAHRKTEVVSEKDSLGKIDSSQPLYSNPVVVTDSALLRAVIDNGLVKLDSMVGVQRSLKRKDAVLDKKIEDLKHCLDSLMTANDFHY